MSVPEPSAIPIPRSAERIRVLIAEDEPTVRSALADLLASDPAVEVVAMAADADEAVALASQTAPDVALVDVKMPGGGGPRAARSIHEVSTFTRVIALSAYEDRRTVIGMLRAGAVGYVVKGAAAEEILRAIRRSLRGQGSLSVEVTADVISELVELLDRSEALAGELQELDRTKSELIQILSHELFTPMTTIQGFAGLVAEGGTPIGAEEMRSLAEGVARAGDRLKRLVGKLSAAARLDRPGVELATRPTSARELLAAAIAEFPRDRHRFEISIDPEDARLWADAELGSRALAMLIENALAFSPPDEPIAIEARSAGEAVEIRVLDRGPGVPEALAEHIFRSFTQADPALTRRHEGLGIGLFLVELIMRGHGGRASYARRPDGGSDFAVAFPALGSELEVGV
jgi:signal transduction histidine kinase